MSQKTNVLKFSLVSLFLISMTKLKCEPVKIDANVTVKNATAGGSSMGWPLYAAYFQVQGSTKDGDNDESVLQVSDTKVIGTASGANKGISTISATIPLDVYGRRAFNKGGHRYSAELYVSTNPELLPGYGIFVNKGAMVDPNNIKSLVFIPVSYQANPQDQSYKSVTISMEPSGKLVLFKGITQD
jgi:hypothetical protein